MPRLTITVPLPPKECQPNFHGHWRARHRAVSGTKTLPGYRSACWAEAVTALCAARMPAPNVKAATVHVTAYYKTATRRDADNILASFKAAFDGFTDAHIWVDDCGVTHKPVTIAKDAANPRAVIVVEWE